MPPRSVSEGELSSAPLVRFVESPTEWDLVHELLQIPQGAVLAEIDPKLLTTLVAQSRETNALSLIQAKLAHAYLVEDGYSKTDGRPHCYQLESSGQLVKPAIPSDLPLVPIDLVNPLVGWCVEGKIKVDDMLQKLRRLDAELMITTEDHRRGLEKLEDGLRGQYLQRIGAIGREWMKTLGVGKPT